MAEVLFVDVGAVCDRGKLILLLFSEFTFTFESFEIGLLKLPEFAFVFELTEMLDCLLFTECALLLCKSSNEDVTPGPLCRARLFRTSSDDPT